MEPVLGCFRKQHSQSWALLETYSLACVNCPRKANHFCNGFGHRRDFSVVLSLFVPCLCVYVCPCVCPCVCVCICPHVSARACQTCNLCRAYSSRNVDLHCNCASFLWLRERDCFVSLRVCASVYFCLFVIVCVCVSLCVGECVRHALFCLSFFPVVIMADSSRSLTTLQRNYRLALNHQLMGPKVVRWHRRLISSTTVTPAGSVHRVQFPPAA